MKAAIFAFRSSELTFAYIFCIYSKSNLKSGPAITCEKIIIYLGVFVIGKMVKHAKAKPKHRTRLMIKNLPFTASEKSVRKIFRKFGEISEVNLPMDGKKPRNKGFAFLEFSSRNSSEKAIKDLNGANVLGR